ncbi:MAG: PEP-CTERM sorting domain-containing protein [Pirellulales bacterium]|nr:PEP-CTERM sorting domain-containing protein [Pirellulales bacterium]
MVAVPQIYAPAAMLGLDRIAGPDSDDLDALALCDNGDGEFQPGVDFLLFSVRRGSAIIGTPDLSGIPIEEGDLLIDAFTGTGGLAPIGAPPMVLVAAEWMGLATVRSGGVTHQGRGDDLVALDVVPEPSSVALFAAGLMSFAALAWHMRKHWPRSC